MERLIDSGHPPHTTELILSRESSAHLPTEKFPDNLSWYTTANLSHLSVISPYYTLSRLILPLAITTGIVAMIFMLNVKQVIALPNQHLSLFFRAMLAGFIVYITLVESWRRSLTIEARGFMLRVSSGIFRRQRISFPLTPFVTITLNQTNGEKAFGYFTLVLKTLNLPHEHGIVIPCLKARDAHLLRDYLIKQTDRESGIAKPVLEATRKQKLWLPPTTTEDA